MSTWERENGQEKTVAQKFAEALCAIQEEVGDESA